MFAPWKKNCDQPKQHIKKQQDYFTKKGPSSQSYGFSSSQVCMWELDYKESWALKNWYFWTVVWRRLESPLDCKEIQPVYHKGNQSWIFDGTTDAKADTLVLWPPDARNRLIGKDADARKEWRQEERGVKNSSTNRASESMIWRENEKWNTRIQRKARIRGPTPLQGEGVETESKPGLLYFQPWMKEYAGS